MAGVYIVHTTPRERILEAAERLLRTEGIASLTTRRVASEVGLTAMAMYRHFRDKDALVQSLVAAGFQRWEGHLARAVAAATPRDRIENALTAYREFALEEPRHFELMFLVPRRGVPLAPDSLRATPSPSFAAVIAAVDECMTAGELIRGDPGQFILLVWALAHGLIALHFTGRFGYDPALFRRRYDETLATLLQRLRATS